MRDLLPSEATEILEEEKRPHISLPSGSLLFLSTRSQILCPTKSEGLVVGDLGPLGQHSGFLGTRGFWGLCKTLRTHLTSLTRRLVTVFSIQPPGSFQSLWHFQPSVLLTGAALQRAGRGPPPSSTHPWGQGAPESISHLRKTSLRAKILWALPGQIPHGSSRKPEVQGREEKAWTSLCTGPEHCWPHQSEGLGFSSSRTMLPTPALGRVW